MTWNRLIPLADLLAAEEKYEREQFAEQQRKLSEMQAIHKLAEAERAAVPNEKSFVYRSRGPELWEARANQMKQKPARRKRIQESENR